MFLRRLVIFSLLIIFSITTLSCQPRPKEDKVTEVVIWIMPNSLEPINDLKLVLKPFEEAHPDIRIKITSVDWGAAWTKITTAATSRDVPDIVQLGSTWVGSISGMNALLDLSDKVDELGGPDAFVPAAWASHGIIGSGKVTAIPWFVDARALYYRTDVFKRLGLSSRDLSTWKSFEKTLKKIKDAKLTIEGKKITPLGVSGKNDWNVVHNLSPWIWAGGGDYLSKDHKSSVLDSKNTRKGVTFYLSLVRKGYVPLEYLELNTAQVSSNFNNGLCAMYFDGPYEVKTLSTPPQQGGALGSLTSRNFGVAPYPQGPKGRFTFVGGSNLAIFKAAKHPEEAWEVIKFLLSPEAQVHYTKYTGFLPAKKVAFEHPFFTANPHRKVFKEAIKYGRTYPCIPSWGPLEPVLTRRFGIMWDYVVASMGPLEESEIQKQLNLARDEVNSVLAQEKLRGK